jgi:molybdopterin synthase catalytic subunit
VPTLVPPDDGDVWLGISPDPLPQPTADAWVVRPHCGASVVFAGTARDHAPGRPGVKELTYEAYDEQVLVRFAEIAAEARRLWPDLGRVAILHRTGPVAIGEASVLVAVSSPHRADAFDAARWCIDTLKETVPIWKRETWEGGTAWGLDGSPVRPVRPTEAARGEAS